MQTQLQDKAEACRDFGQAKTWKLLDVLLRLTTCCSVIRHHLLRFCGSKKSAVIKSFHPYLHWCFIWRTNCRWILNASAARVWESCKFAQNTVCITANTVSLEKCHCVESLWSKSVRKHFLRERWGGSWGWGGEGPMLTSQSLLTKLN